MKNEIVLLNEEDIKSKIYNIRGKEVMLDSDLAILYNVETKRINEAVKNNLKKFPERYSWILNENEWNFLRSKISTLENSSYGKGKHRKYLPRVFTEQGVAMLATILKSNIAIETSIKIMDAFVSMRHLLMNNLDYHNELFIIQNKIINIDSTLIEYKDKILDHDNKINNIIDSFSTDDILKDKLIFKGSFYDAYSLLLDIFIKLKMK